LHNYINTQIPLAVTV